MVVVTELKFKTQMRTVLDEEGDVYDKDGKVFVDKGRPFDPSWFAFDKEGKELPKKEVILCPEFPNCSVYIHQNSVEHREVIRRHVKRKHSG